MTALTRPPRYFVLVVNGKPFTEATNPAVPVIFREEHLAVVTASQLDSTTWPGDIVLEAYADDYSFLEERRIGRSPAQSTCPGTPPQ
ncbi:hypothetical protein E5F05_01780 (plasmid) [Deinococcus metallilatus]|uniref:Uncharacterized protein n=1 Tax=Deinococcus metallilatus TaxID=1211322 RepID=A0ABR6MY93_9DEIO|nr:hypothetical protein [Deinococcus metallilatus]MBB5296923.1 hypothetical protein [Deinococcus metallilatus]QBY06706.1 hypothetical protein E5F05_01780 [Deinococcus metallilatus]GMA15179.1 hypothetical protein GCM10025871_15100 [Deinococcus metallilatus]